MLGDNKYIINFFNWIGGFSDRPSYRGHTLLLNEPFKDMFIEMYVSTKLGPYNMGFELNARGKAKYSTDYVNIIPVIENNMGV